MPCCIHTEGRMIICFPLFPDCFMTFSWFLMFHGALFCIYPSLILWDLCFQIESNWNPMVMSLCWSVLMNRLSQIMMVKSKTKTVFLLFSKCIKWLKSWKQWRLMPACCEASLVFFPAEGKTEHSQTEKLRAHPSKNLYRNNFPIQVVHWRRWND